MKIKVIVPILAEDLYKLDKIAREGLASNGHWQDFDFCLTMAIKEFISKYENKT